ncbi:MAG: hypothetical protein AB8B85_02520 [Paracoccaceae bacterium]
MYAEDTFFHLSPMGRIGLVVISGAMAALCLWGVWILTRRIGLPARVLAGLGAFCVFEWLAPQIHYLWYIQVIDGLPLQWVIGAWPDPSAVWRIMGFQEASSLSTHGRAAMGWTLLGTAIAAPWIGRGDRSRELAG